MAESTEKIKKVTVPSGMSKIPVYDDGGDVDVNDGKHQLAIVEKGERVLTPEQNAAYKTALGLPVDTRRAPGYGSAIPGDSVMKPLGRPGQPAPSASNVKQPSAMPSIAGVNGSEELPLDSLKLIQDDKVAAAKKGDLVGFGKALINEQHFSPMGSALPAYEGPGKSPAAGELIPTKEMHKDKSAYYDEQIQAALDKAATTNDPAYAEQADRLKEAKAEYLKSTPWGSATNHPGAFGRIGHIASEVGNIAGDIVAPATMSLIPGTQLYKARQAAGLGKAIQDDTLLSLKNQEEQNKTASAGVGKTPQELTYHDLLHGGPGGGPKINPDTNAPYDSQSALVASQGTGKGTDELTMQDLMKTTNPETGKKYTRPEAEQAVLLMKAGVKPKNPQVQEIEDWMKTHSLSDTPQNRDMARVAVERRNTEAKAEAALPAAEQKLRLQAALTETNTNLNQIQADALQRGKTADEIEEKETARHNLRLVQINSAQDALDNSDTNELAASIIPVLATMTESNAQGIKRLNENELNRFMPKSSGDAKQWFLANYDKLSAGQIPQRYRGDLRDLLNGLASEEDQQFKSNKSAIDNTLRKGAVTPSVNPKGKATSTTPSRRSTDIPTVENAKYHKGNAKGEILSNDGVAWYDLKGNKIGK